MTFASVSTPSSPGRLVTGDRRIDEVPEREHRVRLAAAERRLEVDDRLATGPGQPPERAGQEEPETLGEVRPGEELARVDVLLGALATGDLGEVGGELRLAVAAGGDVGVRGGEAPPGRESLERLGGDAVAVTCRSRAALRRRAAN